MLRCPNCNSRRVSTTQYASITDEQYTCQDCGNGFPLEDRTPGI